MKNFHRDSKSNSPRGGKKFGGGFGSKPAGRGNFSGRGFGGRNGGGKPSMHQAICDECGRSCEVPFKPTGDRPVLCSDCFGASKSNSRPSGRDRDFGGGRDFGRNRFEEKRMHEAICDGCGDSCEVPFKPTGERPVYCSDCFGQGGRADKPSKISSKPFPIEESSGLEEKVENLNLKLDALKSQLEKMTAKLDKVIRMQAPVFSQEEMEQAEAPVEIAEPKVKVSGKKPSKKVQKASSSKPSSKAKTTKASVKKPVKKSVKKK